MRRLVAGILALGACTVADRAPVVETVLLSPDLAIGPADSGAASFNLVAGVVQTADGHIAILDHQVQELRIFDTSGRFVRLAGRRGAGPSEFTQATGLAMDPDGRIWVVDPPLGRFSAFTTTGTLLSSRTVSLGMWAVPWQGTIDSSGRIYDTAARYQGDSILPVIRRFATDWSAVDTLRYPVCQGDRPLPTRTHFSFRGGGVAVPFLPRRLWFLDSQGHAWCSSADTYRIVKLELGTGETLAVIRGPRTPRALTPREKQNALASVRSLFGDHPPPLGEADLPMVRPFIQSLAGDRQGRLWLQIRTEVPDSTIFDVIDPRSGRRVEAAVMARIDGSAPRWFTPTHALMVALTDDDVPYILRLPIAPVEMVLGPAR